MPLNQQEMDYLDQVISTGEITDPSNDRDDFTKWESDFLSDMNERYKKYGADTFMSGKQWDVVIRIGDKLGIPNPLGK